MSDEHLRALEHRWHTTGDPADEAHYLSARLRTGELNPAHLELAAYLDHAPAVAALGPAAPSGEYVPFARWATSMDARAWTRIGQLLVGEARHELAAISGSEAVDEAVRDLEGALLEAERGDAWRVLANQRARFEQLQERLRELASYEPTAVARDLDYLTGCAEIVLRVRAEVAAPPLEAYERGDVEMLLGQVCTTERQGRAQHLIPALLGRAHGFDPRGTEVSEVAYLQSRVEAGTLAWDRLRLAAFAGHEPARVAIGDDAPPMPLELGRWAEGLTGLGAWAQRAYLTALVRAATLGSIYSVAYDRASYEAARLGPALQRILEQVQPSRDCIDRWRAGGELLAAEVAAACSGLTEAAQDQQLKSAPRVRSVVLLHEDCLEALVATDPQPHLERALRRLTLARSARELERGLATARRDLLFQALIETLPASNSA